MADLRGVVSAQRSVIVGAPADACQSADLRGGGAARVAIPGLGWPIYGDARNIRAWRLFSVAVCHSICDRQPANNNPRRVKYCGVPHLFAFGDMLEHLSQSISCRLTTPYFRRLTRR